MIPSIVGRTTANEAVAAMLKNTLKHQ